MVKGQCRSSGLFLVIVFKHLVLTSFALLLVAFLGLHCGSQNIAQLPIILLRWVDTEPVTLRSSSPTGVAAA